MKGKEYIEKREGVIRERKESIQGEGEDMENIWKRGENSKKNKQNR